MMGDKPVHKPRWLVRFNENDKPAYRQRIEGAPAEMLLRDVPPGRSWFYSVRADNTCTLVEHRVPATVIGSNADPARRDYVHQHRDLTHAEATRMKRTLCGEGLFYAGGPL